MADLAEHVATIGEVAGALGRSETWLRRNWLRLANEMGFPRKHPSGWTWPRAAVEAWLRGGSPPTPSRPGSTNDNAPAAPGGRWGHILDQAYGGSA